MTELTHRPAHELLDDLDARRVSARELLDAAVERNAAVHGSINAIVATDVERARADAQKIDDARARGESLGRLAGLPMTIKDGFDVEGMPAVSGHPAYADRPRSCADAEVVATARAAGALPWGKSNVPLLLGDVQSYNEVYGTTNNPFDLTRTPGGSSGGAAAALAAGITSLEIGSDIGGSLRTPAGFSGVYALKTTWGTISSRGQVPPPPGMYAPGDLGVVGPMASTAADLRLLQEVLSGGERPAPGGVDGMRIGVWLDDPELLVSADVRAGVEAAADALRAEGAKVETVALPISTAQLLNTYLALLYPILSAGYPDKVYDRLLAARPEALAELAAGAPWHSPAASTVHSTASHRDVLATNHVRQTMKDALAAWFGSWDAILAPVTPVPAIPHQHEGLLTTRTIDLDGAQVPYLHLLSWISLATTLHVPALSAPVARTAAGLPVAAQVIGSWHGEHRLLDVADALERRIGRLPVAAL
ncbi:amidase family protein [Pseudonocardia sp. TRM90224]|uniref:amidase family protein n=1 Tax=Pseudonocardia sp. TRM90224 TaxID=2812678 RepID=UPI001E4D9B34|nr:amidase family protein [Pseudonocardia sp. TRM90224]